MSAQPETRTRTVPVVEVFGPTVQGEGYLAGMATHFVRFGLCDYRCEWCDSMYAVDPQQVKQNAVRMGAGEIAGRVAALQPGPAWVTLSGGNPAVHDLSDVVDRLHEAGYYVSVETQGSIWRPWLAAVDHLTVSPKPPSSGMTGLNRIDQSHAFLREATRALPPERRSLKIVVFDDADLDFAREFVEVYGAVGQAGWWLTFLSVGTDQPGQYVTDTFLEAAAAAREHGVTLRAISDRYRWLCEQVAGDPTFRFTRVLPQLHVLSWGHARGV